LSDVPPSPSKFRYFPFPFFIALPDRFASPSWTNICRVRGIFENRYKRLGLPFVLPRLRLALLETSYFPYFPTILVRGSDDAKIVRPAPFWAFLGGGGGGGGGLAFGGGFFWGGGGGGGVPPHLIDKLLFISFSICPAFVSLNRQNPEQGRVKAARVSSGRFASSPEPCFGAFSTCSLFNVILVSIVIFSPFFLRKTLFPRVSAVSSSAWS